MNTRRRVNSAVRCSLVGIVSVEKGSVLRYAPVSNTLSIAEVKMNFSRTLLILAVILLTVSTASAEINQFAGTWKNVDPQTGGITIIKIDVSGSRIKIQTWGKCEPSDCAWGAVSGTAYAPGVQSNLVETANTISTIYVNSFSLRILIIRPGEEGQIKVEALTKFTDQSGRANTRHTYTLSRVEEAAANK
jgi:hypothetical protein